MGTVDDYIAEASDRDRGELERIRAKVYELVPDADQGTSYAMPVYLYRGWQLLSAMSAKNHIGLYPYSGHVIPAMADELAGYSTEKGTIRFTAEQPLTDELLTEVITRRMAEIEAKKPR